MLVKVFRKPKYQQVQFHTASEKEKRHFFVLDCQELFCSLVFFSYICINRREKDREEEKNRMTPFQTRGDSLIVSARRKTAERIKGKEKEQSHGLEEGLERLRVKCQRTKAVADWHSEEEPGKQTSCLVHFLFVGQDSRGPANHFLCSH